MQFLSAAGVTTARDKKSVYYGVCAFQIKMCRLRSVNNNVNRKSKTDELESRTYSIVMTCMLKREMDSKY